MRGLYQLSAYLSTTFLYMLIYIYNNDIIRKKEMIVKYIDRMDKKFFRENPHLETWRLLHNTVLEANKARQKELRHYDISTSQAAVLDCIKYHNNDATLTQVARWLLRESQSVSTLVSRMENRGIIRKLIDPNRKNVIRISMTNQGEELYKKIVKRESVKYILSTLSENELQQFTHYLKKIRGAARTHLHKLISQDIISSQYDDF